MSITVREITQSRTLVSSDNPTGEVHYMVEGSNRPEVVELHVLRTAPGVYAGLVRDTITLTPHPGDPNTYDAVVSYRKAKRLSVPEIGEEEISFEISPQTVRVTQSKETKQKVPLNAPNFGGGVGFNENGFEGADVFVEAFSFSITRYLPAMLVTNAYIRQLRDAAFHVNDAPWRGMNTGECLFMGVSGSRRNADDYALTFRFQAAGNVTNYSINSNLTGINKEAWEYVWVLYDQRAADGGRAIRQPAAAYVERFYDSANFPTLLGLEA